MQRFVGLRSRQDDVRFKAARNLKRYVATELREVSQELTSGFLEELNHMIYDLVSSNEIYEKKGGILAIGKLLFTQVDQIYEGNNLVLVFTASHIYMHTISAYMCYCALVWRRPPLCIQ